MKRAFIIVLCILLLAVVSCQTGNQETKKQPGRITDPSELAKIWDELYDTNFTIGNTREFASAEDLPIEQIIEFCLIKYVLEQSKSSNQSVEEMFNISPGIQVSLDEMLEYLKRYFNLIGISESDLVQLDPGFYDPQTRTFWLDGGKVIDRDHRSEGPFRLGTVTRNEDGTVTAVLEQLDTVESPIILLERTFILQERPDGSMYFLSGGWEYVNNHLVTIKGDYERYADNGLFSSDNDILRFVGETKGGLLYTYRPDTSNKNYTKSAILLINPDNFSVDKSYDVGGSDIFFQAKLIEYNVLVKMEDRVLVLDYDLNWQKEIPLPKRILDIKNRPPEYDKEFEIFSTYYGGYDISSDLKKLVYTDEVGLKLFNLIDNSERLLVKTVKVTDSELINRSFHASPKFIDHAQKVITMMTGYEEYRGYSLYDLKKKSFTTTKIGYRVFSPVLDNYGLLEIYAYDESPYYLDFATGTKKEFTIDMSRYAKDSSLGFSYTSKDYAAFIIHDIQTSDYTGWFEHISRLNLKTKEVETGLVTVRAASVHILGVLNDGRIIFSYYRNPSEKGICITK